jgi:hypothetical protein
MMYDTSRGPFSTCLDPIPEHSRDRPLLAMGVPKAVPEDELLEDKTGQMLITWKNTDSELNEASLGFSLCIANLLWHGEQEDPT